MHVAALQFDVRRGDVEANRARCAAGLREAAAAGVQLLALPEMWATSFVAEGEDDAWLAATDEAWRSLCSLADELGVALCGSAFGAGAPGERLRNRFRLHAAGAERLTYDKVHLFSPTAEAAGFSAGDRPPPTVELAALGGLRVSAAICYDLRFPALLDAPFQAQAELLVVPAQWPVTRAAHWTALCIGRAVEQQAFVLGVNRTGRDLVGRRRLELAFPGNSLLVSPHGRVLAEGRGEEGLVGARLDRAELRELRRRVPVRQDQVPRAYREAPGGAS